MIGAEVFPFSRIVLDVAVSAVANVLILWLLRWRSKPQGARGIGEDVVGVLI
jgi:hypothetical protein